MIYCIALLICTVVFLTALYRLYCFVFGFPPKMRPDVHNIPESEGYTPHLERMREVIRDTEETPHEVVEILAEDETKLYGRLYTFREGAPLLIAFHGYHGNAAWDGFGYYRICKRNHINILLVDQRSHGKSGGNFLTFGVKERLDCRSWVQYAAQRMQSIIYLAGVSMGAATVMLASALELPANVRAVIADCGYSDAPSMIQLVMKSMKLPVRPVYALTQLGARIFGGFSLKDADVVKAVENTDIPTLFLHGDRDPLIPLSMNEALYEHCKAKKKRVLIKGALHANSAMTDFDTYEREIVDFLNSIN